MGKVIAGLLLLGLFNQPNTPTTCQRVGMLECMGRGYGPEYCEWHIRSTKEECDFGD